MQIPYLVGHLCCHHCCGTHSNRQHQRFSERQKQNKLAAIRGEEHIGSNAKKTAELRKLKKIEKRALARRENISSIVNG